MKTSKKILICFLLVILTCSVVFVPMFLSGQNEKDALSTIARRSFSATDETKLTSEQVARLYFNNDVVGDKNCDIPKESIFDILDMMFSEDEAVCDYLKGIVENSHLDCIRSKNIINIDNQSTVLSFVRCSADSEQGSLSVVYEEKTNTIIDISVSFYVEEFKYEESIDDFIQEVSLMISNYYETKVGMYQDEYYFNFIHPSETQNYSFFSINGGLNGYDEVY